MLILAQERDPTADDVVAALTARGVEVLRIDMSWFPAKLSLHAELHDGRWEGWLRTPHHDAALSEIRSAWYRSPATFQFPSGLSVTERQYAHTEAKLGLGGVLTSLPILWVNHPARNADAEFSGVRPEP